MSEKMIEIIPILLPKKLVAPRYTNWYRTTG
jgi:hypothetical protein